LSFNPVDIALLSLIFSSVVTRFLFYSSFYFFSFASFAVSL